MSDDLSLFDLVIVLGMFGGGFFLTWMFIGAMKQRNRPPGKPADKGPIDRMRKD